MKKSIIVVLVLGLIAGGLLAAPAQAKKRKRPPAPVVRTFELPYQCPCGPSWGRQAGPAGTGVGFWLLGGTFGGGTAATGSQDKFVKVEVVDQSGQAVLVSLGQDADGDSLSELDAGSACGTSEEPIAIPAPGSELSVFVYDGFCNDGTTPSIATSGVVKLTFSNVASALK